MHQHRRCQCHYRAYTHLRGRALALGQVVYGSARAGPLALLSGEIYRVVIYLSN